MTSPSRREFLLRSVATLPILGGALLALPGCKRSGGTAGSAASGVNTGSVDAASDDDDSLDSSAQRPAIPTSEPLLRIRIMKLRGSETRSMLLRVGSSGQSLILRRGMSEDRGLPMRGPVDCSLRAGAIDLLDSAGMRAAADMGDWAHLAPDADEHRGTLELALRAGLAWDGMWTYPGSIRLVPRPAIGEGALDVVNYVFMEDYLPGVLAGELYRQWHVETFAAQAVAARSYACTEAAVFRTRRVFDMSATTTSQMYLGRVEHDKAHEAVRMTRGLMLGWKNTVVSGYYSSCCGGTAATAVDAFGHNAVNDVPPLEGREGPDVCNEAPVYAWTADRDANDLRLRLNGWGKRTGNGALAKLGRVAAVRVAGANPHGRPNLHSVIDDAGGSVSMRAEDFRRAANHTPAEVRGRAPDPALRSSQCSAALGGGGTLQFTGNGFGHGVGLCQYGAQALAKSGSDHRAILDWYYPGAEAVKAY